MEENTIEDKVLTCRTCQKEFPWSKQEQRYYEKKGFKKQPQKCSDCRDKANKLRNENMFYIHCGLCKKDAAMITPPPKDRVAICDDCYKKSVKEYQKNKPLEKPAETPVKA
ncbi:MAG: zinc-ribbon domain containing protein [bacterium]